MNKNNLNPTQLTNRILINFGIGILAYILLWVLLSKFYMMSTVVFPVAGAFAAAAVVFYILHAKKSLPFKNYAHMFVAFTIALIFTQSAYIVSSIMGMFKFSTLVSSSDIVKKLFNQTNEVRIIAILGGVYLVVMLIYNIICINKYKPVKKEKKK